eukprot:1092850-Prymnesium_polylepis.1
MAVAPALRVRFDEHAQAERALAALRQRGRWAELEYNERPYDGEGGRGWCIAEQGAAKAVAAHLRVAGSAAGGGVPERFRAAEASRPKVVELPAGGVALVAEGCSRQSAQGSTLEGHSRRSAHGSALSSRRSTSLRETSSSWVTRRFGTEPGAHLDDALQAIERGTTGSDLNRGARHSLHLFFLPRLDLRPLCSCVAD